MIWAAVGLAGGATAAALGSGTRCGATADDDVRIGPDDAFDLAAAVDGCWPMASGLIFDDRALEVEERREVGESAMVGWVMVGICYRAPDFARRRRR